MRGDFGEVRFLLANRGGASDTIRTVARAPTARTLPLDIVTSQRKLKKRAEAQGMTATELQLTELLQEVLSDLRWMQILAYSNQYLMNQKLKVTQEERDQILEAATRAVDKDSKLHEWSSRLDKLKGEITNIKRKVNRARKDITQGRPAPDAPPGIDAAPREGTADAD